MVWVLIWVFLKSISGGDELSSPSQAAASIVYGLVNSTPDSMTIEVAYSGGYWTFKLVKDD